MDDKAEGADKRPKVVAPVSVRVPPDTKGLPDAPGAPLGAGTVPLGRWLTDGIPPGQLTQVLTGLSDEVVGAARAVAEVPGDVGELLSVTNLSSIIAGYTAAPPDNYGQWLDTVGHPRSPVPPASVWQQWALHDEIADRLTNGATTETLGDTEVSLQELQSGGPGGGTVVFTATANLAGINQLAACGATEHPDGRIPNDTRALRRFTCSLADLQRTLKPDHPLCRRYEPLRGLVQGQPQHHVPCALALLPCLRGTTLDLRTTPFLFGQLDPDSKSPGTALMSGPGWKLNHDEWSLDSAGAELLKLLNDYVEALGMPGIEHLYLPAEMPVYTSRTESIREFFLILGTSLDRVPALRSLSIELATDQFRIDLRHLPDLQTLELLTGAAHDSDGMTEVLLNPEHDLQKISVQASLKHKVVFKLGHRPYAVTAASINASLTPDAECERTSWTRALMAFEIVPDMRVVLKGEDEVFQVSEALRNTDGGIDLQLSLNGEATPRHVQLSSAELAQGAVRRAGPQQYNSDGGIPSLGYCVSKMVCDFAPANGSVMDMMTGAGSALRVRVKESYVIPELDKAGLTLEVQTSTQFQAPPGWKPDENLLDFSGTIAALRAQVQRLKPARTDDTKGPASSQSSSGPRAPDSKQPSNRQALCDLIETLRQTGSLRLTVEGQPARIEMVKIVKDVLHARLTFDRAVPKDFATHLEVLPTNEPKVFDLRLRDDDSLKDLELATRL